MISQWNEAYEISDYSNDKECERIITLVNTYVDRDSEAPSNSPVVVVDDDGSVSSFDDEHEDEHDDEYDDEHDEYFRIISIFPADEWCVQPEIDSEVDIDTSASIIIRKCDGSIAQEW